MLVQSQIKESFQRILPQKDAFAATFYKRLLQNHPQFQPLFEHVSMQRQHASLIATLTLLVSGSERGEDLTPAFHKLGRLHFERSIRPEHYPAFGDTLMETMALFDPAWTPAHREAWSSALDACVREMMKSYEPTATQYRVQISGVRTRRP